MDILQHEFNIGDKVLVKQDYYCGETKYTPAIVVNKTYCSYTTADLEDGFKRRFSHYGNRKLPRNGDNTRIRGHVKNHPVINDLCFESIQRVGAGMKILSIDCEFTDLEPEYGQLLEVAMVLLDTSRPDTWQYPPRFHALLPRDRYWGDEKALEINKELIDEMADMPLVDHEKIVLQLQKFVAEHSGGQKFVLLGKNISIDLAYLNQELRFAEVVPHHHRKLDIGNFYVDLMRDCVPPDLSECMRRAGLEGGGTHRAMNDAMACFTLLLKKIS